VATLPKKWLVSVLNWATGISAQKVGLSGLVLFTCLATLGGARVRYHGLAPIWTSILFSTGFFGFCSRGEASMSSLFSINSREFAAFFVRSPADGCVHTRTPIIPPSIYERLAGLSYDQCARSSASYIRSAIWTDSGESQYTVMRNSCPEKDFRSFAIASTCLSVKDLGARIRRTASSAYPPEKLSIATPKSISPVQMRPYFLAKSRISSSSITYNSPTSAPIRIHSPMWRTNSQSANWESRERRIQEYYEARSNERKAIGILVLLCLSAIPIRYRTKATRKSAQFPVRKSSGLGR